MAHAFGPDLGHDVRPAPAHLRDPENLAEKANVAVQDVAIFCPLMGQNFQR